MQRFILAVALVIAISASAFAAASALSVNGGVLQAGSSDVVCDTDGIYVSAYGLNTYPVLEGVEYITVKGVSPACNGARIMGRVELNTSDPTNNASYYYTSGTGAYATGYSFVIANGNENTEYQLFLKEANYTTQVWVPAENIVAVKFWLEGQTP